jgi:hypothetical protein
MRIKMWAITYPGKPTFYLCPHVCGIVDENHAIRIASDVMSLPVPIPGGFDKQISAVLVDIEDDPTLEGTGFPA